MRNTLYRGTPRVIGIAAIVVGNMLEPHAKALHDLADRARVVWAAARNAVTTQVVATRFGLTVTTDSDQAIHTLDLFCWCLRVARVEAAQTRITAPHRMGTEDYAAVLVRPGNGAPGSITATTAGRPGSPGWISVSGTRGTARLEGSSFRPSLPDGREAALVDAAGSGNGSNLLAFSREPRQAVLVDFLDAIEQDRDPAIPGDEALETHRLIGAIMAKGGT